MSPIRLIGRDLAAFGCRWALVGGHAVSARAVPRFTKDVDLCVAVASDAEAEHVVRGFHHLGYRVLQLLEHEPTGRLGTARLALPGSASADPELDLLFVLWRRAGGRRGE